MMALERRFGPQPTPLALVTARITIELGVRPDDGSRGITYLFEDLTDLDEDGNPHLLGYFDGKLMLACGSDEFYHKHFHDDGDDDDD